MQPTSPDNPFASIGMPTYGAPLSTKQRNSALTLARFKSDGSKEIVKSLPSHDAYIVIYQLREMPAHDVWLDGKLSRTDDTSASKVNIFDLKADPCCRLTQPFENIHVHIPRAALDDIADEADSPKIAQLRAPDGWNTSDPVVSRLIAGIVPAMERPSEASRLYLDHMVLALHAHLARTYGGMRDAARAKSGGLAPWQERRAKELLAANLGNEVPLQEIAGQCGLSVSYFSRAFKASTGATPHEWLQARRVDRAKDLLMDPDLSLAEIALSCGFADQSHFTRIFTRIAGDTPGAWRRFRRAA